MAKKKNFVYIVVCHNFKLRFVTACDYQTKTAEWNAGKDDKPYQFATLDEAQDICCGLLWSGVTAYPVVMRYELTDLPYHENE